MTVADRLREAGVVLPPAPPPKGAYFPSRRCGDQLWVSGATARRDGEPALRGVVGADVTIGHQAMLHGCTVGDRVMIGMQTMIMDGAVVESDVMLAAGSLVSPGKRLASGWLYRGRPARAVRELTAKEIEFLPYVAGNYVKLKDQYLDEA